VLREPATAQPSSDTAALPANLRRQVVDFRTTEQAGTIIIDTPNTYLYYVLGGGKAIRYGIGVGRGRLHLVGRCRRSRARPSGRIGTRPPR